MEFNCNINHGINTQAGYKRVTCHQYRDDLSSKNVKK
jgi:hypothetical protein